MLGWLAASGCGETEAVEYQGALSSGRCELLAAGALRDWCWVEHVDCDAIVGERARYECAFRRAEKSEDAEDCKDAGAFAEDCQMHLWTASFRKWAPDPPVVGRDEPVVAEHIARGGFIPDDPRPWSAWYRYALSRQMPMDRGACRSVPHVVAREACLATGVALYDDRLNAARDLALYPCDGGELPSFLHTTDDPDIVALRVSRNDLCP